MSLHLYIHIVVEPVFVQMNLLVSKLDFILNCLTPLSTQSFSDSGKIL